MAKEKDSKKEERAPKKEESVSEKNGEKDLKKNGKKSKEEDLTKGSILVVDDEEVIRSSVSEDLQDEGYYVDSAESGHKALEKLKERKFDMVFMDLKMPDMNGIETVEKFKPLYPETDFVMVTGFSEMDNAVKAMDLGALDYVLKPFTSDELTSFTKKAFEKRKNKIIEKEEEKGFLRFSSQLRVQHIILLISFSLLSITGIPLLFPDFFLIKKIFFFSDSSMLRGLIHRINAVILALVGIYHIAYCLFTEDGNKNFRAFMPDIVKDLSDAFGMVFYNLGIKKDHPRFRRFNFVEKSEYLAVLWGTAVMVFSGIILWFENIFIKLFPFWVILTAKIIHRYEAILAVLAILIWHFYHAHYCPEFFPMSKVWLTGKLSRKEMIKHHPLEYEEITGRKAEL